MKNIILSLLAIMIINSNVAMMPSNPGANIAMTPEVVAAVQKVQRRALKMLGCGALCCLIPCTCPVTCPSCVYCAKKYLDELQEAQMAVVQNMG